MCLLATRVKQLIIGIFLIFALLPSPVYAATQEAGTLPLISDVSAINITTNSATISWNTTANATSQVFYDTVAHSNIAHYADNVTDANLVAQHSINLTGLTQSTTYHYRAKSVIGGDEAVSADKTFTTLTGGGGGGWGGGGLPFQLKIDLAGILDWHSISFLGQVMGDIERTSVDGKLTITIPTGTIALNEDGAVLLELSIAVDENPPPPPAEAIIIGPAYKFEPTGATFNPSMIITFNYRIPEGVDEESLFIAYYNVDTGQWVKLKSVLDTEANTVSAEASHLTTFALLAHAHPAAFTVSGLLVTPAEVDIGRSVTISVLIANTVDLTDSYKVALKIDNAVVATKEVTLAGGASQRVTFTTAKYVAGTYSVDVSGLTGSFIVKEEVIPPVVPPAPAAFTIGSLVISPIEVDVGKSVTIGVLATNTGDLSGSYEVTLKIDNVVVATKEVTLAGGTSQQVTFTTTADMAGTHSVDVNGLTETFTVEEEVVPPAVPKAINWWLMGGIIAGVIAISVVVWQVIVPRRA